MEERIGAVVSGWMVRTSLCTMVSCLGLRDDRKFINYSTLMHRYIPRVMYPLVFNLLYQVSKRHTFDSYLSSSRCKHVRFHPVQLLPIQRPIEYKTNFHGPANHSQFSTPDSTSQYCVFRICSSVNRSRRSALISGRLDKHGTMKKPST
jgi:hypothetical protein